MDTPQNIPDPDLKRLLEQNLAFAKDNNRMLHLIRRNQVFGTIWTIAIWAIALAVPLYLYQHYLEPIASKFYIGGPSTSSTTPGFPTYADFQKFLEPFQKK